MERLFEKSLGCLWRVAETRTGNLTRREEESALFVAQGLTNPQIAAELSVSEYMVDNHIAKILRKLGLNTQ